MISFSKLLEENCPYCQNRWRRNKNLRCCFQCNLVAFDIRWLRKDFERTLGENATRRINCFYWYNPAFGMWNSYYDENGKHFSFPHDIEIYININQKTLQTLINFQ